MGDEAMRPERFEERVDVDGSEWTTEELADHQWGQMIDALDGFGELMQRVLRVRENARSMLGEGGPCDWDGPDDRRRETYDVYQAADAAVNALDLGMLSAKELLGID